MCTNIQRSEIDPVGLSFRRKEALTLARRIDVLDKQGAIRSAIVADTSDVLPRSGWRENVEVLGELSTFLASVVGGSEEFEASDGGLTGFDVDGWCCVCCERQSEHGDEGLNGNHFEEYEGCWVSEGVCTLECYALEC